MKLRIEVVVERDDDSYLWRLAGIRQSVSWEVSDWVHELISCNCLDGIQGHMLPGERKRLRVRVSLWSSKCWTDCGYEYDSGLDVLRCRTVRKHRVLSPQAWRRRHYTRETTR